MSKVPENYEWEIHNLFTYEKRKRQLAAGEITQVQFEEFCMQYRETPCIFTFLLASANFHLID